MSENDKLREYIGLLLDWIEDRHGVIHSLIDQDPR